ncbi:MAG: hypothetical protein IJL54_00430 [Prevotella sp.]|nr:hypothetical protein [Prevotella sp.]
MDNPSGLWGALFGSFAAGLIVAIIQYLIAWQDYIQTEKLKKLKLKEVLYNRTTRSQYEEYIRNTNRRLDLMGVTAVRFFNDFADTSVGAPDNAIVLLQALERGVHVRVLLPTDEFLPEAKRIDSAKVKTKYKELTQRYQNIEIRYFGHTAAHSIFRIDDSCIIGPVFPLLESRNTPALHVMNSSPMALNYLDYFESEWNQAIQEHA